MTRVLSGVQPTGNLHLGNYLGAIKNWVDMQDLHECLYCIVDLHAITVPQDPEKLRAATRETAAAYIACGIDPKKSVIFHQSAVPEHSELAWLLSTITPLGWLNRMTQFKEKAKQSVAGVEAAIKILDKVIKDKGLSNIDPEKTKAVIQLAKNDLNNSSDAKLGLYSYPVLMAADILIYKATHVPVGEDQKQHLELTRDIAGAFNRQYNQEYFPLPEPLILGEATRVMSLRDGTKKMSKSEESDYSRINLTDSDDLIRKKIKKAKSDIIEGVTYDIEKRPEISNLLSITASSTGQTIRSVQQNYANYQTSAFKNDIAEKIIEHMRPIRTELQKLSSDKAYLDGILREGANKARAIASVNIEEIKKIMGFLKA